jgi:methionyl-tRNA formyltransferase
MRLAFMGTPAFAAALLPDLVAAGHDVAAVYTQPPKPRGRGQSLRPTPVHEIALGLGLKVLTPETLKTSDAATAFRALDLDAAVVVAYGQILRQPILEAPRLGCFNVHASLLPRWRGAAPIQRALMAGDPVTGVQVMRMAAGLDEGPVLSSAEVAIQADDTAGSLHDRLQDAARILLPETLRDIELGRAVERPQAEEGVTYARKISSEETRIDWTRAAAEVDRTIRGLSPSPGAWFELPTQKGPMRVKALSSRLGLGRGAPGEMLDDNLLIACGEGALRLLKVQREGRTGQSSAEFLRGLGSPSDLKLL